MSLLFAFWEGRNLAKNALRDSLQFDLLGYGLLRAWIVAHLALARHASFEEASCTVVLFSSIVLSSISIIAIRKWMPFKKYKPVLATIVLIAGLIGSLCAFFGQALMQPVYLIVGFGLIGICSGFYEVEWGYRFLPYSDKKVYCNVLLAFLLAAVIGILSSMLLPDSLFLIESVVLLGSMGAFYFYFQRDIPNVLTAKTELSGIYDTKSFFLKSKTFIRFMITCLLFSAIQLSATSICYNNLPVADVYWARFIANYISAFLLLVVFLFRGAVSPVGLFKAILLITAVGLFLQLLEIARVDVVPIIILLIGNKLFDAFVLIILIKLIQNGEIDPTTGFGLFVAAKNGGNIIGVILGDIAISQINQNPLGLAFFIAVLVTLLLTTFLLVFSEKVLFKPFNMMATKESLGISTDIQMKALRIAAENNLTQRESEMLALLARGKNKAAIANEQNLSKSTVHSHMMNIYRKLDVHNQQELISMVERSDS